MLMSVSIGLVKMEELVLIFLETTNVFVQEDSQDHIVKRVSDTLYSLCINKNASIHVR